MADTVGNDAEDGRRLRRQRGRTRVVDAMLDLIVEEGSVPEVDALAGRAGVSVASVYRYFDNLDDLRVATIARTRDRYADLFEAPPIGSGGLEDRVESLVRVRAGRYETLGPVARLVRARAPAHPALGAVLDQVRGEHAAEVRTHFARELGRLTPARADDVVVSVVVSTSFEAWDLQIGLGRTPRQVRRAWRTTVRRLVTPED